MRTASLYLALIISGWFVVALIAGNFGRLDTLIVPMVNDGFYTRLPADILIVGRVGDAFIFKGNSDTLAADLREAGAVLILPARAKSCLEI